MASQPAVTNISEIHQATVDRKISYSKSRQCCPVTRYVSINEMQLKFNLFPANALITCHTHTCVRL